MSKILSTLLLFSTLSYLYSASKYSCEAIIDNTVLEGKCKGALKDGEFIGYHVTGMPSWVVNFKNDVLHGTFMYFHPNGSLHFKGAYKHGKLDGKFTQYNMYNEKLEARFKMGVLNNWLHIFNSENKKIESLKYYYGKLEIKKYLH